MKNIMKLMSLLLVFCMLFSLASCGGTNNATSGNDTGANPDGSNPGQNNDPAADGDYSAIAGEYLLDASALGMPMKWYIKVTADGKFMISTARDYATLKGDGTLGYKDGVYMFIYSDSTNENLKTATFAFEGKNMVFSTSVPIGAASVSPNLEEEKYPTAKLIACEDILGTYLGSYEKQAMGSALVYNYELTLGYGLEYTFSSSFTMGSTSMTRTEIGTFAVDGSNITFTAATVDGEKVEAAAATGTIADKTIKAPFLLSKQASAPQEIEARLGEYAEYAGVYTAVYEKAMGPSMTLSYGAAIQLDAFGGYEYATVDATTEQVDYQEKGTYTVENGKIMLKSDKEGSAAVEATLANYVLSVKLPISTQVPMSVALTFYAEEVSGVFYATTEHNSKSYSAVLSMVGNEFALIVTEGTNVCYAAIGTFEIKGGMMTNVVFTTTDLYTDAAMQNKVNDIPPEIKSVSAPMAEVGINAELAFDIDDTQLLGFQFTKNAPVSET